MSSQKGAPIIIVCPKCHSEDISETVDATINNETYERVRHNPNNPKELNDLIKLGFHDFSGITIYECNKCGAQDFRPIRKSEIKPFRVS